MNHSQRCKARCLELIAEQKLVWVSLFVCVAMRSRDTAVPLFSSVCEVGDVRLGRGGKCEEISELYLGWNRCIP